MHPTAVVCVVLFYTSHKCYCIYAMPLQCFSIDDDSNFAGGLTSALDGANDLIMNDLIINRSMRCECAGRWEITVL